MRFRGRPWLGAVSGFFLGFGVAVLLQQFAVRPLDNLSFFGLPILGLLVGLGAAAWAPLGRGRVGPTGPSGVVGTPTERGPEAPPPPPH